MKIGVTNKLFATRLPRIAVVVAALSWLPTLDIAQAAPERVEMRRGFADVARKAAPAVVFIHVEKTIQAGVREQPFNDPFDLFGDEFFERFFGQRRAPGRSAPRQPAPRQYRQAGQGSGFIVRDDGYILTNNHVVGDADRITVRLQDGREFTAERVGTDPRTEIALIKIDAENLPTVAIGDAAKLEIGEWVVAIGNPFGLSETLTAGVVSAKGRSGMGIADYEDFIQTDAAINPGNSGGPLLNIDGEVVGINTAIYSRSGGYMGIGFAIPIDMALNIMEQLITDGRVTRGYLGIMLNPTDVDEQMAESFGLDRATGVLVADVVDDTPAADAGLKAGDIILDIEGREVTDNNSFRRDMASIRPGARITLGVFRDGESLKLPVTIGTFPEDEDVEDAEDDADAKTIERLGFTVQPLSREVAERLGYETESGVVIAEVLPGGPAERSGLRAGMLVLAVNRDAVKDVREFEQAVTKAAGHRVLLRVMSPDRRSWFVLLRPEDP